MAEIDKSLPNTKRTKIDLPDQKDIQETLAQEINREQALKPNTDSDWDTINNPQAKELAVQLGLAS